MGLILRLIKKIKGNDSWDEPILSTRELHFQRKRMCVYCLLEHKKATNTGKVKFEIERSRSLQQCQGSNQGHSMMLHTHTSWTMSLQNINIPYPTVFLRYGLEKI